MRHIRGTGIATLLTWLLVFAAAATATQEPSAGDRRTPSAQSTVDALQTLIHAGKFSEMMAKVDTLGPGDPAWKRVMELLMEAAERQGDYSYVKRKARDLFQAGKDPETRAISAFALGVACWKSGELPQAEAAFADVGKILPDSELAQAAVGNIHEIRHLGVGQPAPLFVAQNTAGAPLSLDDLKGKVVLLNFWASWCGICAGEFPLLKEVYAKFHDRGLVIVSGSIDDDREKFERALKKADLPWKQVFDGKGTEGELVRLFNARAIPVSFLIDTGGRIAAKIVDTAQLQQQIVKLMEN